VAESDGRGPTFWRSSLAVGVAAAVLIGGSALAVFRLISVEPPLLIVQPSAALPSPPPELPSYDAAAQLITPTSTVAPTPSASTSSAAPSRSPARPTPTRTRPAPVASTSAVPPPQAPAPTRTTPAAQFSAAYVTTSDWHSGFAVNIEVTNRSSVSDRYELRVTYPSHVRITIRQYWGDVRLSASGRTLHIVGNGPVAGGGTVRLGYLADKSRRYRVNPVSCTINGVPCRT